MLPEILRAAPGLNENRLFWIAQIIGIDPERMGGVTDMQLLEIISAGKGTMPAFSAVLSAEEIQAVVEYVRSLSAAKTSEK